ncbi:hypothetical protein BDV06DRAFT_6770 [Aspergillus oleicola]
MMQPWQFVLLCSVAFFHAHAVASGVRHDDHICPHDPPCVLEPYSTRPIAMNLDIWTITAAHAHTPTNTTILANIPITNPTFKHNLTAYKNTVNALRKHHAQDYARRNARKPQWRKWLEPKWKKAKYQFDETIGVLCWILKLRIEMSASVWLLPVRLALGAGGYGYEVFNQALLDVATETGVYKPRRDIPLDEIRDAFTEAFRLVRQVAFDNTGVNITSAIVLYPDFYNTAIQRVISDAAYNTSISSFLPSMQMTHRQLFERHANPLLFYRSNSRVINGRPNLLLLNQGFGTFDLLTSGEHCLMNIPLDELSCFAITGSLFRRLAREDRYPVLREEVHRGANAMSLFGKIANARWFLKGQRKADTDSLGQARHGEDGEEGLDGIGEIGEGEGELADEWPLDLKGWWVSDAEHPILLRWEDVEAVDREYVDYLADCLDGVQMCLQGATRSPFPPSTKSTIDGVIMLDNYCDGSLLTRAAKKSTGSEVRIFGGSEGADSTYLARLGAQAALRMYEEGLKERREYCSNRKDAVVDEDEDEYAWWYGGGVEWDEEIVDEHDEL